jgi:nuclear pore complex protein Nup133
MASPSADAAPPPPSTRSRRRQRPLSSENSIAQPKAKRQRSALNEHTFVAPDASPEMQQVRATKTPGSIARRESARAVQRHNQDLVVRGKKPKSAERGTKGDGSVVLVCCFYEGYWTAFRLLLTSTPPD